jgi:hypothetical protein
MGLPGELLPEGLIGQWDSIFEEWTDEMKVFKRLSALCVSMEAENSLWLGEGHFIPAWHPHPLANIGRGFAD